MATSWRIVEKLCGGSLCGLKFLLPFSDETLCNSNSIPSSTSNDNNAASLDSASTSNCFQYLAKDLMVKLKSQSEKNVYMSMSGLCGSFPITDCEAQPTSLFVKWLKARIPLVPSLLLLMMNRHKSALAFPCGHLFTSSSSSSEAEAEAARGRAREAVVARAREVVSRYEEAQSSSSPTCSPEAPVIARAREVVSRYEEAQSLSSDKGKESDQCVMCSSGCIGCQKPWGFLRGKLASSIAWPPSGCNFCFTGCVFCYKTKTKTDEILMFIFLIPFLTIAFYYYFALFFLVIPILFMLPFATIAFILLLVRRFVKF
ncbi:hypothetical protein Ddye_006553 [Dipteronia dyeriana]|uniref:Uncharacterized protein n=1 Tax=Dipteronia dyeriana TaxID=168575 RepID=A0AAD9XIK7_9ROSI|nr:hypothetical protein Ddye_006553 [Dipteronia dyeriana]